MKRTISTIVLFALLFMTVVALTKLDHAKASQVYGAMGGGQHETY